ncbi:MAG: protein translocase subunit SecD [Deltaproteobacteria bacterium]|nr:protein translocase subunit SecD [Deltaproteobacteria bacterium]MBW2529862.1 protein translocase subunit SecD [Deltaproteobacteria bacterium]
MIHDIMQYGFAAIAALSLLGAWLARPQRMAFLWSAACASTAAAAAHYDVFWPVAVFGLMIIWSLFYALPIMQSGWRAKTGLAVYVAAGAALAIFPTYHDERYGKEAWVDPSWDAEQRVEEQAASRKGERGLKRYVLENIPFRLVRGLDLKGGMRLVYTVDVDEAIKDKRDRYYDDLRASFTKAFPDLTGYEGDEQPTVAQMQKLSEKIRIRKVRDEPDTIVATISDPSILKRTNDQGQEVEVLDQKLLQPFLWELNLSRSPDRSQMTFRMHNEVESRIRERAVSQAKQTIQRRVDGLGLKEAAISVRDEDIIIEIPGQDESAFQEIKEIISQTARLEFKMVDDDVDFFEEAARTTKEEDLPKNLSFAIENAPVGPGKTKPIHYARIDRLKGETMQEALNRLREWVATLQVGEDHEVGYGRVYEFSDEAEQVEEAGWRSYYLWSKADVTGDMVRDAQARPDPSDRGMGGWNVSLQFTPLGAERFEEVTGANVKRRFAIILDGRVESAPVIQEKIGGGHAQITMGSGSVQEQIEDARKLELVLRSGALPAPISRSNEQLIGPSLGHDSIEQGVKAALLGGGFVLLLMFLFYRRAGFIANFAVIFNLVLQIAVLSMFSASLTLPGIAGLALVVGMAVDANVLINERIKEELRAGKSARAAVATGYEKAFSAIIDGNVTTLISGLILAQYGTGPIKGFAVTLIVGIITNLFTGVVVTRLFFEFWVRGKKTTQLGLT